MRWVGADFCCDCRGNDKSNNNEYDKEQTVVIGVGSEISRYLLQRRRIWGGIYDMSGVENLLSPAAEIASTLAHVARVRLAST